MTKEEFKTYALPVKGTLFRLALALLGNRPEAEDAVQDVYMKLWNMRLKLPEYDSIEALAVTMTKNLCIDKLRSYRSRNQNAEGLEHVIISTEDRHNPIHTVELNESLRHVHEIIARLPEQQRMVLHMRDIELYKYDEIEAMTGMNRNNIRVTLSRARKSVREQYLKKQHYEHRKN